MSESTIEKKGLIDAILALFDEAHVGPTGKGTWFIDNDPGSGLMGTLEGLDAARASKPLWEGDPISAASHAAHVRFALGLANRAAKGENPYKDANWSRSWDTRKVSEAEWKSLISGLRTEYEEFRKVIAAGKGFDDPDFMTGTLGLVSHAAWHLGAIREGLGLVRAPKD
jgi:hypothetical protein